MSSSIILQTPCATCPFRKDRNFFLYPSRRQEIAQALLEGAAFSCHNTVHWDEDDPEAGDESYDHGKTKHCAGAAKSLMLSGGTTQMMRIAERLGDIDLEQLEDRGPEVWPLDEWQRLNDAGTEIEDDEEIAVCETCNPGCLAPAGTLGNSGAILTGTESADGECAECGTPLCSNCADDQGLCYMCTEEEEQEDY